MVLRLLAPGRSLAQGCPSPAAQPGAGVMIDDLEIVYWCLGFGVLWLLIVTSVVFGLERRLRELEQALADLATAVASLAP